MSVIITSFLGSRLPVHFRLHGAEVNGSIHAGGVGAG
jgi:hypothetical protein